jgi:sarcosine oxidase delta subunit
MELNKSIKENQSRAVQSYQYQGETVKEQGGARGEAAHHARHQRWHHASGCSAWFVPSSAWAPTVTRAAAQEQVQRDDEVVGAAHGRWRRKRPVATEAWQSSASVGETGGDAHPSSSSTASWYVLQIHLMPSLEMEERGLRPAMTR